MSMTALLNKKQARKKPKLSDTNSKRCAAYIRVSTEEQAVNPEGSIKNQEERIKQALSFKNSNSDFGTLVNVFVDRGRSGKDMNRPELMKMINQVEEGKIDLIIVSDLSRLSRSIRDFSQIWEFFQSNNCGLWSLRENFDTSTAAGEMMLYSIANFAQFERKQTAERVSANFQARASRGLFNGGAVPIGYNIDPSKPGHLAVDEKAAATVRTAFSALLSQGTISAAAKWLNANGYVFDATCGNVGHRARLKSFNVGNLSYLLKNPIYVGIRRYHLPNGKYQEAKSAWPSIIDEVTFEMVQMMTKTAKRRKVKSEPKYPFLLTGKVFCSKCGQSLAGKTATGSTTIVAYYEHASQTKRDGCISKDERMEKCNPMRVQAKLLETRVFEEIQNLMRNKELQENLFSRVQAMEKKASFLDTRDKLHKSVTELEAKINALLSRLSELPANLPATAFYQEIDRLQQKKVEQEEQLRTLPETDSGFRLSDPETYRRLLVRLERMVADTRSVQARRSLINALIHQLVISENGLEVKYYVGEERIKMGEALASPMNSLEKKSSENGSFLLRNGWGARIRT